MAWSPQSRIAAANARRKSKKSVKASVKAHVQQYGRTPTSHSDLSGPSKTHDSRGYKIKTAPQANINGKKKPHSPSPRKGTHKFK